ncbi:MAG: hypothetical protein ACRD5M_08970 [Candidatus Acidiferrales bacterium]
MSHLNVPVKFEEDIQIAWTVIEAVNLWAGFLRAYYLSGAILTRTRSGKPVKFTAKTFPNKQAALKFAIQTVKDPKFNSSTISRYDEPAWHNSQKFIILQKAVAASNLAQIYSAFAAGSTFAPLLKDVRNFYAHRCDETFRSAATVGVKLGLTAKAELRASRILCSRLPKRPQNVITDWLDDMANVFDLLSS